VTLVTTIRFRAGAGGHAHEGNGQRLTSMPIRICRQPFTAHLHRRGQQERAPVCRRIVLAARAARVRSALTNVRPRIAEEKIGVVVMVITS
jgi:hypothetical protein